MPSRSGQKAVATQEFNLELVHKLSHLNPTTQRRSQSEGFISPYFAALELASGLSLVAWLVSAP